MRELLILVIYQLLIFEKVYGKGHLFTDLRPVKYQKANTNVAKFRFCMYLQLR